MILKIYQAGQPVLRTKARSVNLTTLATSRVQDLIDYMIATLRDAPGVGLAAPQVGEALRIIIIDDKAKYHAQVPAHVLQAQGRRPIPLKVLINPSISIIRPEPPVWFEGCLSVDGYVAAVARAASVRVTAVDRTGAPVTYIAHNWHARILQHEFDHLNGALLIDSMRPPSFMSVKNFTALWREATAAQIDRTFPI